MKIIIIKKKRICTRVVLTARSIDTNKQQIECLLHTHTHTPGMAIINHSRLLTHFQSHRWERILQCQKIKMCVNIIYIEMEWCVRARIYPQLNCGLRADDFIGGFVSSTVSFSVCCFIYEFRLVMGATNCLLAYINTYMLMLSVCLCVCVGPQFGMPSQFVTRFNASEMLLSLHFGTFLLYGARCGAMWSELIALSVNLPLCARLSSYYFIVRNFVFFLCWWPIPANWSRNGVCCATKTIFAQHNKEKIVCVCCFRLVFDKLEFQWNVIPEWMYLDCDQLQYLLVGLNAVIFAILQIAWWSLIFICILLSLLLTLCALIDAPSEQAKVTSTRLSSCSNWLNTPNRLDWWLFHLKQ